MSRVCSGAAHSRCDRMRRQSRPARSADDHRRDAGPAVRQTIEDCFEDCFQRARPRSGLLIVAKPLVGKGGSLPSAVVRLITRPPSGAVTTSSMEQARHAADGRAARCAHLLTKASRLSGSAARRQRSGIDAHHRFLDRILHFRNATKAQCGAQHSVVRAKEALKPLAKSVSTAAWVVMVPSGADFRKKMS